jgi:hypothetical protein
MKFFQLQVQKVGMELYVRGGISLSWCYIVIHLVSHAHEHKGKTLHCKQVRRQDDSCRSVRCRGSEVSILQHKANHVTYYCT